MGRVVLDGTHTLHRGAVLHFSDFPADDGRNGLEYFADGAIEVAGGKIVACGEYAQVRQNAPADCALITHADALISAGFVDTHIHSPQASVIASFGTELLEWLERYTFPAEMRFANPGHCRVEAQLFLETLLSNGTTTALAFCTVHPQSADAFFEAALKLDMRMIAGKVLMDRNAPAELCDTPAGGYEQSQKLIEKWHSKGRLSYAVTPRFAPTSTPEQLSYAGRLLREYPDVHMQTHLSENKAEIQWVKELFPDCANYLDVYDKFGLLGSKSLFAHGIHLEEGEWHRLGETESAISFCPTSNLFLGSGLFDVASARRHEVKLGLGTDVGGGTSFSLLRVMDEAYKVACLRGTVLTPLQLFYLATLGGAKALGLDGMIGNFEIGKEADFIVLDSATIPLLNRRVGDADTLAEKLFAYIVLGDERAVSKTYVHGEQKYSRGA